MMLSLVTKLMNGMGHGVSDGECVVAFMKSHVMSDICVWSCFLAINMKMTCDDEYGARHKLKCVLVFHRGHVVGFYMRSYVTWIYVGVLCVLMNMEQCELS